MSVIWFAVWSSVVHAGIMAAQALANSDQRGHLWRDAPAVDDPAVDAPAVLVVAGVLARLTPRGKAARTLASGKK
jgi:hypothetical protein